ncbi:antibiotic biosynthesis monooxygenase [Candidatus Bathyarchaeota archaeon]|nr:antibiotic biosynthesis monooxygenase [Candidatus Bathyarchaeota archaeon]
MYPYEFHRSIEDPTEFMFYERYVNQEAHETHAKMLYVQNFLKKSEELLSRPLELHRYTRITN